MSGLKSIAAAFVLSAAAFLAACQSGPAVADPAPVPAAPAAPAPVVAAPDPAPEPAPQTTPAASAQRADYMLDTGDKLKITVFGEEALSGEFEVDGTGDISMQLIGEVTAKGLSLRDLQRLIETKYKEGQFLRSPQVSAEVMNYRPFYIRGEVKTPGEYPYTSGLSVQNAIARAGDFTYRADRRRVFITSKSSGAAREVRLTPDLMVQPGDTIEIKDRLF